jgi:hypothetical protein
MISIQNIWSRRSERKPADCAAGMKTAVSLDADMPPGAAWNTCVLSFGIEAAREGGREGEGGRARARVSEHAVLEGGAAAALRRRGALAQALTREVVEGLADGARAQRAVGAREARAVRRVEALLPEADALVVRRAAPVASCEASGDAERRSG